MSNTKPCRVCGENKEHYASIPTCCKDCWKKRVAARRIAKIDEIRAYDRMRSQLPHRKENDRIRNKLPHRRLASALWSRSDDAKESKLEYSRRPENKAKRLAINQSLRKRRKGYNKAHNYITRAVKSGIVIRPPRCERCGVKTTTEAHHDDHLLPDKVMWLCSMCHTHRHQEIGRMPTAAYGIIPKDDKEASLLLDKLKKDFRSGVTAK